MYWWGSARAPDLPVATFFFLSSDGMVWHQSVRKNKIFSPRARTRNLEGRPPQGGDLRQKHNGVRARTRFWVSCFFLFFEWYGA